MSPDRGARIAALDFNYASQPKQAVTACNLCGATEFVVLSHRDRYGYPAQAHACRRCGLVFLNPRMTAESYGRFYNGTYRPLVSAFHGRLIDAQTIQDEQREYAAERAEFVSSFMAKPGGRTMLDIGGSTGVVAHLRSSGFEVLRSDYAADHLHVSYVFRPSTADADVMPAAASVDELVREVRFVQNTRGPDPSTIAGSPRASSRGDRS